MPREILVDWTMQSGSGKLSVFFFDAAQAVGPQRVALNAFLTSLQGSLTNTVSWSIRTAGRELSNTDGSLTAAWTDASVKQGTGTVPTEQVADATQVLFQWHTNLIADGRFLRGRQFFPGLASSNLQDGNLVPGVRTGFQTYGATLVSSGTGFVIWHRPKFAGSPPVLTRSGSAASVSSCTVWTELAVLRRRRG